MKKSLYLLPLAAVALMGAGCGASPAAPSNTSVEVEEIVDAGVEIPADFPSDIPVYANGTVTEATIDPLLGASLSIDTKDSMDDVYNWYIAQLKDWKKTAGSTEGKSYTAIMEKDKASISISIYKIGDTTTVNVSKTVYDY